MDDLTSKVEVHLQLLNPSRTIHSYARKLDGVVEKSERRKKTWRRKLKEIMKAKLKKKDVMHKTNMRNTIFSFFFVRTSSYSVCSFLSGWATTTLDWVATPYHIKMRNSLKCFAQRHN